MFVDLVEDALGYSDAAIDAELREIEVESRRLEARRAALIGVSAHRGAYRADGHRSVSAYLRALGNASHGEATRLRTIAEACADVPALGEALLAGHIGVTQIVEIGRIRANPRTRPFFERVAPIYLERAEHDSAADLRDEIDSFLSLADEDGAFAELYCEVEQRTASVTVIDGTLDIRVSGGDALVADEVVATFEWFLEREFRRDVEERAAEHGDAAALHPLPRTDRQRRFDAIVAMARAARAYGDGATPADVVTHIVADPQTTHDVLARHGLVLTDDDVDTITATAETDDDSHGPHDAEPDDDDANAPSAGIPDRARETTTAVDPARLVDRRCRTSRGTAVHPELLLRALLTGHVRRVVVDGHGVVVDWGRTRRLFSGPARDAAKLLARRCTHPGCLVQAGAATIDHIDEWVRDLGRTDQRNADVPCNAHNRFKSRAGWRTRRDDRGRPWRIRADGTVVLPAGARPPSFTLDAISRPLIDAGWSVVYAAAAA